MFIKKYLAAAIKSYPLHLKAVGKAFVIPFAVYNILLPVLLIKVIKDNDDPAMRQMYILLYFSLLLPFFSVFHSIFTLKEYTEGIGSEALYVCPYRVKLAETAVPFLVMLVNACILFAVFHRELVGAAAEIFCIISVCIFLFGLIYLMAYVFKSTTANLLIILLYVLFNLIAGGRVRFFPFYYGIFDVDTQVFLLSGALFAVCGAVFTVIGVLINRRRFI